MDLQHLRKMKIGYKKKLKELKTYGSENRNPERIADTISSIQVINSEILKHLKS